MSILKRDTEKVLEVISKVLMPVLLLILGTWFNWAQNSNQEKQRQLEQKQADQQRRSELIESYIKHLASTNPMERQLALHIMTLDSAQFDAQLVNLVTAYASVAPPEERITALEALNHASHSKDASVSAAAAKNISSVPAIPTSDADNKTIQQKAAIVNQALQQANVQPNQLGKALDQLHLFK